MGIALSGGGYRAALMQASVLDALESLGVRIDFISSVSGGAIISSFNAIAGRPKGRRTR